MNSSRIAKGHKELILISLLTLAYAILMIALEYKFQGNNWLLSQTVRFVLGIGVFFLLFKGNVGAKGLVITYLVINIVVGVLRTIASFQVGWNTNGLLFAGTAIILGYCLFIMVRSKNINYFLSNKNEM